jgi:hypothetical protein
MGPGTTTMLMNLLAFLAGSLPALALLYLRERMHQERESQWMRIFSVKSLEIPGTSMESSQPTEENEKRARDNRKRLSIPLPVPDYAKDVYRSVKRG